MERFPLAWIKGVTLLAPLAPNRPTWRWVSMARWDADHTNGVILYRHAVLPSDLKRFWNALLKTETSGVGGRTYDPTGWRTRDLIRAWLPTLGQWRSVRLRDERVIYQSSEDWYRFGYHHLPGGTVAQPPYEAEIGMWEDTEPPEGAKRIEADPPLESLNRYVLQLYWEADRLEEY